MKIGILTFHKVNNYGAVLQNYALQKVLANLGCEAETIDYRNNFIYKPYGLTNLQKKGLSGYVMGVGGHFTYAMRGKNTNKFRKHMKFSKPVSKYNINTLLNKYDMFISGSDQVWNYKLTNFDKTYLLDFVDDKSKKASYAASFGVKEIDEHYQKEYEKLLSDFQYLSVREQTGANIIRNLVGSDARVVSDPCLLLSESEWLSVAEMPDVRSKYILVYQLGFCASTISFVKNLAEKTGCKVICLPFPMGKWIKCRCGLTEGPAELLGLIKNAECVVTSSFHCTVFSILFNKDFFVEIPKGIAGVSSRVEDMLDEFGLRSRFLVNGESENMLQKIDYMSINQKLIEKREESIQYLKSIIYGASGDIS
jgi:hypothetical protein